MLLDYFLKGTENTVTGQHVGLEIETDFVDNQTGRPISDATGKAILALAPDPTIAGFRVLPELGRQKIELALNPQEDINTLLSVAKSALNWLYSTASQFDARPVYGKKFNRKENLLMVTEPRDQLWLDMDGQRALEALCRCSSIQFTIDVNPREAIDIINKLWQAKVHQLDYTTSNDLWQEYITNSHAEYKANRYGGPSYFKDMTDYVDKISEHAVVMHKGKVTRLNPAETPDLDLELFVRSVWWHYRLRRYNDTLAVEIRPLTRRSDECLEYYWNKIAPIFQLPTRRALPFAVNLGLPRLEAYSPETYIPAGVK